jgi:adenylate cyclase
MAKEIERKFLVRSDGWRSGAETKSVLRQGYIASMDDRSVRVRIIDEKSTADDQDRPQHMTRDEFEYEIPVADAEEMLGAAIGVVIEKTRYRVPMKATSGRWTFLPASTAVL